MYRSFAKRHWLKITALLTITLATTVIHRALDVSLRSAPYWSGGLLLAIVTFLALYSLRKKLSWAPIGSSAVWLQLHIYTGLFGFTVFQLHTGPQLPNGLFESVLAGVYVTVFLSGVTGLVVSRCFARRLTGRGPQVLFERVPEYLKALKGEAERLLANHDRASPLIGFYSSQLSNRFDRPQNCLCHLVGSTRPQSVLRTKMKSLQRYLNQTDRAVLAELETIVLAKDDLDYQYSLQLVLKYWPFLHVPLTYALLLMSLYHVVLVHAFLGNV